MNVKIRLLGDPLLRIKAEEVTFPLDEQTKDGIASIKDTLYEFKAEKGFGRAIAAPQIGILKRIIGFDLGGGFFCMINPVIKYQDEKGNQHCVDIFDRSLSELIQHEYDHLDGILAIDRATDKQSIIYRSVYDSNREYFIRQTDKSYDLDLDGHEIRLTIADADDALLIHKLQKEAFLSLLDKYKDHETNPACEPLEKVLKRINMLSTDYYIITKDTLPVGGIRIDKKTDNRYRISPVFIIPEFWGQGTGGKVLKMIEEIYNDASVFMLDTILQEQGTCRFYENLGFVKTGRTQNINEDMTLVDYEKEVIRTRTTFPFA